MNMESIPTQFIWEYYKVPFHSILGIGGAIVAHICLLVGFTELLLED